MKAQAPRSLDSFQCAHELFDSFSQSQGTILTTQADCLAVRIVSLWFHLVMTMLHVVLEVNIYGQCVAAPLMFFSISLVEVKVKLMAKIRISFTYNITAASN